jgi:uroporphyrinogen-III synthase
LTHAKHSLRGLKENLESYGCNVLHFPLISIKENTFKVDTLNFDWIIFTSRYGVQYFFEGLNSEELSLITNGESKFSCIGKYTASKLSEYGFSSILTSEVADSEALAKLLINNIKANDRVLLVLGNLAGNLLEQKFTYVSYLHRINVYKNILVKSDSELKEIIKKNNFDRIVFSSPSSVCALKEIVADHFNNIDSKTVSIGNITAKKLQNYNIDKMWIANNGRDSLLDTIINSFKNNNNIKQQ